jgi:hypothetical protein
MRRQRHPNHLEDEMMIRIVALLSLVLLGTTGSIALAVEQVEKYIGLSNFGRWGSSSPMELAQCQKYVNSLQRAFVHSQIGPGDSMVQEQEAGLYKVTWKNAPTITHLIIFKCVPILRNDDGEAGAEK